MGLEWRLPLSGSTSRSTTRTPTSWTKLAARAHMQEGTLARSLLSTALDDVDPDAERITEILDAIPGAWERTQEGIAQAARGQGTPLDKLA